MAGSKKHHYQRVMAENPNYFGKHGFKRPLKMIVGETVLNVGDLDEAADRLVASGHATKKGRRYTIDVARLGIDKILGSGKITRQLNLTGVKSISVRAREKVTGKGGTIDLPVDK
jgi:large subunit ribosomal protein L15